jgi:hypothetical protein
MTPFLKTTAIILVLLATNIVALNSQNVGIVDPGKRIAFRITGLTIEKNKQLITSMSKSGTYKIAYCCLPAGILILETEQVITDLVQTKIEEELNSVTNDLKYIILDGFTIDQAERECSAVRNTHIQNK